MLLSCFSVKCLLSWVTSVKVSTYELHNTVDNLAFGSFLIGDLLRVEEVGSGGGVCKKRVGQVSRLQY